MTLYLIRHGQSAENTRSSTSDDSPLTELGLEQARRTAAWLADEDGLRRVTPAGSAVPTLVYTSPARRTLETAREISSACDAALTADPDICEYGMLYNDPGLTVAQMRTIAPRISVPPDLPVHGGWAAGHRGESTEHLVDRVERALDRISREHPAGGPSIAVVSHAHFSGFFLGRLLNVPVESLSRSRIRLFNCGVAAVEFTPEYRMLYFANSVAHLNGSVSF
ncbi:MAG: histidine phosphatase family protein [Alkalispirochaeta sp.]